MYYSNDCFCNCYANDFVCIKLSTLVGENKMSWNSYKKQTIITMNERYLLDQYDEMMEELANADNGVLECTRDSYSQREIQAYKRMWGHDPRVYEADCQCPACSSCRRDTTPPAGCGGIY